MSETYTLLLVDDNVVNRELWSFFLSHEGGYKVLTAEDGLEALRTVGNQPVDLVLLDVMMPGIDGFEVLSHLRRSHTPEALPVIMCTAKGQSEDVVRGFDLGANDYVAKPLDHGVVLARIQAQLRGKVPARQRATRLLASIDDVHPGIVIDEKYRLDALIDQGSFGAVYKGRHLTLERPVAVKLLAATLQTDETSIARFQREGISACRLTHPNAVSVLDFNVTEGGLPYLVMELLEGRPFDKELLEFGPLEPRRAAEILVPVCQVLAEAHAQGIVHRDVKPQNIFLHYGRLGEVVKVLDFGIAKMVGQSVMNERITTEGSIVGTPAYMAPERLSDGPYDGRSDVFSVGVVLYEALTGRRPFVPNRGNLLDLMRLENRRPPPALHELRPEMPPELDQISKRVLADDPEERPDAQTLATWLAEATGLPLVAAPAEPEMDQDPAPAVAPTARKDR